MCKLYGKPEGDAFYREKKWEWHVGIRNLKLT